MFSFESIVNTIFSKKDKDVTVTNKVENVIQPISNLDKLPINQQGDPDMVGLTDNRRDTDNVMYTCINSTYIDKCPSGLEGKIYQHIKTNAKEHHNILIVDDQLSMINVLEDIADTVVNNLEQTAKFNVYIAYGKYSAYNIINFIKERRMGELDFHFDYVLSDINLTGIQHINNNQVCFSGIHLVKYLFDIYKKDTGKDMYFNFLTAHDLSSDTPRILAFHQQFNHFFNLNELLLRTWLKSDILDVADRLTQSLNQCLNTK